MANNELFDESRKQSINSTQNESKTTLIIFFAHNFVPRSVTQALSLPAGTRARTFLPNSPNKVPSYILPHPDIELTNADFACIDLGLDYEGTAEDEEYAVVSVSFRYCSEPALFLPCTCWTSPSFNDNVDVNKSHNESLFDEPQIVSQRHDVDVGKAVRRGSKVGAESGSKVVLPLCDPCPIHNEPKENRFELSVDVSTLTIKCEKQRQSPGKKLRKYKVRIVKCQREADVMGVHNEASGRTFDESNVEFHPDNFSISLLHDSENKPSRDGYQEPVAEQSEDPHILFISKIRRRVTTCVSPMRRSYDAKKSMQLPNIQEEVHRRRTKSNKRRNIRYNSNIERKPTIIKETRKTLGKGARIILKRCMKCSQSIQQPAPINHTKQKTCVEPLSKGKVFLEQITLQDYMRRGMVGLMSEQRDPTPQQNVTSDLNLGPEKSPDRPRHKSTISNRNDIVAAPKLAPVYRYGADLSHGTLDGDSCYCKSRNSGHPTSTISQQSSSTVQQLLQSITSNAVRPMSKADSLRNKSVAGLIEMEAGRRIDWARTDFYRRVAKGQVCLTSYGENTFAELELEPCIVALKKYTGPDHGIPAAELEKYYQQAVDTFKCVFSDITGYSADADLPKEKLAKIEIPKYIRSSKLVEGEKKYLESLRNSLESATHKLARRVQDFQKDFPDLGARFRFDDSVPYLDNAFQDLLERISAELTDISKLVCV